MTNVENEIERLFEEYVPSSGSCETVLGEIVRAVSRIGYRYFNDGDCIGVDYGNETCNAPARFLKEKCDTSVRAEIVNLWGEEYSSNDLLKLERAVLNFINKNKESLLVENTEDMYDYSEDEDLQWDYEEY